MIAHRHHRHHRTERRGLLLVIVLAVLVLLSLACYEMTDRMTTTREAVGQAVAVRQAELAAESGVDRMLALLSDPALDQQTLSSGEIGFADWAVNETLLFDEQTRVRCQIVVPDSTQEFGFRFGPVSECGKININALADEDVTPEFARDVLLQIPGMTETLADTILDFIDADADPRVFGTESGLSSSEPFNRPIDTLDDLLNIDEVDALLIYGEDANANGLLDFNENDGEASAPFDNADGVLDLGWQRYLTVMGRVPNARPDGEPRININADDLATLETDISAQLGAEAAAFVVAVRESGLSNDDSSQADTSGGGRSTEANASTRSGGSTQTNSGAPSERSQGGTSLTTRSADDGQSTNNQRERGGGSGQRNTGRSVDGNENGRQAQFRFTSLAQLIGSTVASDDRSGPGSSLSSPWQLENVDALYELYTTLTLTDEQTLTGRIDLNSAPYESLIGLPGLTESTVGQIVDGAGSWDVPSDLVTAGLITVDELRTLEPFVTTEGRTFRFQSVGDVRGGPAVRLEVVVDTAQSPPRILRRESYHRVGLGWSRDLLNRTDVDVAP